MLGELLRFQCVTEMPSPWAISMVFIMARARSASLSDGRLTFRVAASSRSGDNLSPDPISPDSIMESISLTISWESTCLRSSLNFISGPGNGAGKMA